MWSVGRGQGEGGGVWQREFETKQVGFSQNEIWVHCPQNSLGISMNNVESCTPPQMQYRGFCGGAQDHVSHEFPLC